MHAHTHSTQSQELSGQCEQEHFIFGKEEMASFSRANYVNEFDHTFAMYFSEL